MRYLLISFCGWLRRRGIEKEPTRYGSLNRRPRRTNRWTRAAGGVFRNLIHPAMFDLNSRRRVNSTVMRFLDVVDGY
jgi:hypothetical protein